MAVPGTWALRDRWGDLQGLFLKQTDPFYRLKCLTSARRKRVEQRNATINQLWSSGLGSGSSSQSQVPTSQSAGHSPALPGAWLAAPAHPDMAQRGEEWNNGSFLFQLSGMHHTWCPSGSVCCPGGRQGRIVCTEIYLFNLFFPNEILLLKANLGP